jgi:hypothetical protein
VSRPRADAGGLAVRLRRAARVAIAALALALACALPLPAQVRSDEMRVHAAYLMNFVRYSRWPEPPTGGLVVAVLGTPDSATVLRDMTRRAGPIHGQPVTVRLLPLASLAPPAPESTRALSAAAAGAHVLYVADTHRGWARAASAVASERALLTVGTGRDFLGDGGMITLYADGANVRFAVNAPAIKASRVDVSARLLVLARLPGGR